jgi:GDP-L-fucose synthase
MVKKRILVCGATGFIGRNMIEYFANDKNFELHAVYNKRPVFNDKRVIWHNYDLTNDRHVSELFKKVKPQHVIQAAATTSGVKDIVSRPQIHVTDNAVMNSYLFKEAVENDVEHVIFFSCTVMYQSSEKAIREVDYDSQKPIHHKYFGVANTKIYLEKMCEFYSSLAKTKFTAIRHSNIYGPYDKYDLDHSHFFGATVSKVMTAKDTISVWGTGEEERDLLHVNDLTNFVAKVLLRQQEPFKLYHCGLGLKHSVLEVIKLIIKVSGKEIKINNDLSMPTIKTSLYLDCSLALNELGWSPQTSLLEGINNTINWWKENIDPATLDLKSNKFKKEL